MQAARRELSAKVSANAAASQRRASSSLLGGWLHVKAIDTDAGGAALSMQALNKVRRRYVQMVEGRALRIFKDVEAARAASRPGAGDSHKALATLLLYETIFLRPGGDKFTAEFGKNAKFVMQIISQHATWFIAAEDEATFKKWLRVVATNIDSSAVCDKFAWAVGQKVSSPRFKKMAKALHAISSFYRRSRRSSTTGASPAGTGPLGAGAGAGAGAVGSAALPYETSSATGDDLGLSPAETPWEMTEASMASTGSVVPECAGLLGTMSIRRSGTMRQDDAVTVHRQQVVFERMRRFLLQDQVLHVYGSIFKQLTACYDILGFEFDGGRLKTLDGTARESSNTVPLRTPQHEVSAEATLLGSRIVEASLKLHLAKGSKGGGGGGGGSGVEGLFKIGCANPWLVDQLSSCKRHMLTALSVLPHPTRSKVFWSSLNKVEVDLTAVSKHLLKALEQLQSPSAAQQSPKNFPIRGAVGCVFRPRLPANVAVEFSVHKCNLVLSAYELQPTRPGHSIGVSKVVFNRRVHDIVAMANARFPLDSLREVEQILRQAYSDCQALLQRVLAFRSAYTMNPMCVGPPVFVLVIGTALTTTNGAQHSLDSLRCGRPDGSMHPDQPLQVPNPTNTKANPYLQASETGEDDEDGAAPAENDEDGNDESAAGGASAADGDDPNSTTARWKEYRQATASLSYSNWVATPRKNTPLVSSEDSQRISKAVREGMGGGSKE